MAYYPALGIRPVNMLMLGKGEADKLENSMGKLQLGEAERLIGNREALKGPMGEYATGDRQQQRAALGKIAGIDPDKAAELRAKMPANDLDQLKGWATLFRSVKDRPSYVAALQAGKMAGLDSNGLPMQYDQNVVDVILQVAGEDKIVGPGSTLLRGDKPVYTAPFAPRDPAKRQTVVGPDGKPYFVDTQQPVLPGVKSPRDTFMEMIGGGGDNQLGGGAGNDQLQPIRGVPDGATLSAGTDAAKPMPTVRELFNSLPPEVQMGIKMSKDPMQAFSAYMTKSKGLDIQFGPDGKVTSITQGGSGAPMQKATQTKIEEKLFNASESLARLDNITAGYRPEYLTYPEQFSNAWTAFKSKTGILNVSPEETKRLTDYTMFRRDAVSNMNLYIKEITGAQMSEAEAERIRKGIPDPENDSPPEFAAKLIATKKEARAAIARYAYLRSNGLSDGEIRSRLKKEDPMVIGLDMVKVMDSRAANIEAEVKARNPTMTDEQIRNIVKGQLRVEFALGGK